MKNVHTGSVSCFGGTLKEAAQQQWLRPCAEHGVHNNLISEPTKMPLSRPFEVTVWYL